MRRRVSDREHPTRGFSQQMDVLQIERIAESRKIPHEPFERPRIARARITRATVPAQIAPHNPIVARQHRHPLPPELRRSPKPVLYQNSLPRLPRLGEVVVLEVSDVSVEFNFRHLDVAPAFWGDPILPYERR